ncbi:MAG: thioesterase [Streptosporangiaceae bacterium]|nr:thioesterase [Streptosporangiaceae bacterium]
MASDPDLWIRRYHPAPESKAQLVCFPHAGGSASFYFPVSAALTPAIDVAAVQYPGRQDRRAEPNVCSIPDLADAIFDAIRPLATRPLAFFGHSMGAILAYEVAVRLENSGAAPLARLYVSGRRAPSCQRQESVHQRSDQAIIAELEHLSGTSSDLLADPEALAMILPAIKSDYRAIETYRPLEARAVRAPVTAIIGAEDSRVTVDEAKAWHRYSTASFDLRVLPGGHFYLVDCRQEVIRLIAEDLVFQAARLGDVLR